MKNSLLFLFAALGALFAATACSHLDLSPEGDPSRVLNGTVTLRSDVALPPDAVMVVRVIDAAGHEPAAGATAGDLPVVGNTSRPAPVERVLGEQTIKSPGAAPIPFHVEYSADDGLLRHGLNVDVRISFGGRVQYRTANAHVVTLSSANYPHEVWVEPAAR